METTITTLSQTEQELTLTLQPSEFKPEIETRYKEAQATVELKGFRKGKVPMDMIKRLMGKEIEADAVETLAQKHFSTVAEEKDLKLIGRARIRHFDLQPEEKLTIHFQYEVEPEFELKPFDGYAFTRTDYEIQPSDIEGEVNNLLRQQGVLVANEGEAGAEDFVTGDMQKLDEQGIAILGKRFENQTFNLGDASLNPSLRQSLAGVKVGDERRIELEFHDKDGRHQHDRYSISIKEVKRLDLPELTDSLAEELTKGKYAAADALRQGIADELKSYYTQKSEGDLREAIAQKFVTDNAFDVPNALTASFQNSFVEDAKQRLNGQLPKGFDVEAFKREIRPNAEKQAKWTIVKRKLSEASGVKVEPEDYRKLAEKEAADSQGQLTPEQLLQFYTNEQMRYVVAERILNEKIYEFLKSKVSITTEMKKTSDVKETDDGE